MTDLVFNVTDKLYALRSALLALLGLGLAVPSFWYIFLGHPDQIPSSIFLRIIAASVIFGLSSCLMLYSGAEAAGRGNGTILIGSFLRRDQGYVGQPNLRRVSSILAFTLLASVVCSICYQIATERPHKRQIVGPHHIHGPIAL